MPQRSLRVPTPLACSKDEEWYDEIYNKLLAPGCLRTCKDVQDNNLLYCNVRKKDQPVSNFPPNIHCHRARSANRGTLTCNKCATPTCTNTQCRARRTCYSTKCKATPCKKHHALTPSQLLTAAKCVEMSNMHVHMLHGLRQGSSQTTIEDGVA